MSDDGVLKEFGEYVSHARQFLALAKDVRGLIPTSPKADAAQAQIDKAEEAFRNSEAKLAQALGYQLCECTWPAQIMLSVGRQGKHGIEVRKCPRCGKQTPSEQEMARSDRPVPPPPTNWIT